MIVDSHEVQSNDVYLNEWIVDSLRVTYDSSSGLGVLFLDQSSYHLEVPYRTVSYLARACPPRAPLSP